MQQARSRVIAVTGAGTQHRAADVADAVTHFEICHAGADFFNHAGRFSAQPRGQLDRVHARAYINILKVKTNGGMANSHFALGGLWQIKLLYFQNFRAAGGVESDCFNFHRCLSW